MTTMTMTDEKSNWGEKKNEHWTGLFTPLRLRKISLFGLGGGWCYYCFLCLLFRFCVLWCHGSRSGWESLCLRRCCF